VHLVHADDALDEHTAYLSRKLATAMRTALKEVRADALVGVPNGTQHERQGEG